MRRFAKYDCELANMANTRLRDIPKLV